MHAIQSGTPIVAWAALALLADVAPLEAQRGRLSPMDSTAVHLDGEEVAIVYSRPSMRGRVIFGELVPWNEVWRTGANEATAFRTTTDLRIGEAEVPAGEYTLYTIPAPEGWTLIINRQTGQWGTEYHPERDLVRIPMRVEALEEPVETFTISLVPREESGGGILAMEWERTRAWVPFRILDGDRGGG